MRELGVVLVVVLAVGVVIALAARLRESRRLADGAPGPAGLSAPSGGAHPSSDDALLDGEAAPRDDPASPSWRTAAVTRTTTTTSFEVVGARDAGADSEATVGIVDAILRVATGEISREEGLALVRAADEVLSAAPAAPGRTPSTATDVLVDVAAGIGEQVEPEQVADTGARALLEAARSQDTAAVEAITALGPDAVFDRMLALWATWDAAAEASGTD
ncbi:hypothetical protein [Nocardioides sp.]|uniref:hypothetical protein n=1 Tax=Nocardioides sp. TaxID=35761 RepID=UPI003515FBED